MGMGAAKWSEKLIDAVAEHMDIHCGVSETHGGEWAGPAAIVTRSLAGARSGYGDARDRYLAFLNSAGSPIEKVVACCLTLEIAEYHDLYLTGHGTVLRAPDFVETEAKATGTGAPAWLLATQHEIGEYRADFVLALYTGESHGGYFDRVAIECDGHDFHERTKEQAARDRRRDRYFQTNGWRVLRFTGSEIWNDPVGVAREAESHLYRRFVGRAA